MSTAMEDFKDTLRAAKWVSTPLLVIRTADPTSAIQLIAHELFNPPETYPILRWDLVQGFKAVNEAGKPIAQNLTAGESLQMVGPHDAREALATLHVHAYRKELPRGTIVFLANAHRYITDTDVLQAIYNLRDCFPEENHTLVLLTVPGARVPVELSEHLLVLDEPLPTRQDMRKVLEDMIEDTRGQNAKMPQVTSTHLGHATDALMGLTIFSAQQTVAMSLSLQGLNLDRLWSRKVQIIQQTPGLSVWKGGETFGDIAGVGNIKDFLGLIMERERPPGGIMFLDEFEKQLAGHGTDLSGVKTEMVGTLLSWMQDEEAEGLIFVGPPGTAKSATAKAAGNSIGIPTIAFDFGAMQGSLVGQSGQNLRTALQVVEAVTQSKPLVIATCNNITGLPSELRRRFTLGTFFFDLPNAAGRAPIWNLYQSKYGICGDVPDDAEWSGADIKNCCYNASEMKISLERAAGYIVPVGISSRDQIRHLRLQASGKYIDAAKPGPYIFDDQEKQVRPSRGRAMKLAMS